MTLSALPSPVVWISAGAIVVGLIAVIIAAGARARLRALSARVEEAVGLEEGDVLDALVEARQDLKTLRAELAAVNDRCAELERRLAARVVAPGVVRFNAFPEMGSDLSFSVAFTDIERNGVVLSTIQGREAVRVYAKPLIRGESPYSLTPEEMKAIDEAGTDKGATNP